MEFMTIIKEPQVEFCFPYLWLGPLILAEATDILPWSLPSSDSAQKLKTDDFSFMQKLEINTLMPYKALGGPGKQLTMISGNRRGI